MDFIRGKYKMLLCIILPHMSINTKNTIFRYIKQRAASLFLGSCRLSYLYIFMSFQGSFKNGVVSAFPLRKIVDFTGFFGTFQDTAVIYEYK